MSLLNKDDIIIGAADAYRAVTNTTDKIKTGQLIQNIKNLSGFEDKIEYAIVDDLNGLKLLSKCTNLKKVYIKEYIHGINATSPEIAPFKNADNSLVIYFKQNYQGSDWGTYFNYVRGEFVPMEFDITEEQFKRICLGYDRNSFHYEYRNSWPEPGKHYLITRYTPRTLPRISSDNKLYQTVLTDGALGMGISEVKVDEEDGLKIYPNSLGDSNYGEWACLPGTNGAQHNDSVPSTYMFQNVKTGKYLFNPCYEEGNNNSMSVIEDPLTDGYSPFSRQVFNSQGAIYSFYKDSNENIHITYNPNEPKCIEAGTNQYNGGASDPWIKFNCGGIDGFEDLSVVYYNHNINGQPFQLFTFFNVPSNDFHVANLESNSPNSWHVFHSYDSLQTALYQRGLLESYRIDLDMTNGRYWLANAICTKNIYARLMVHHYLLNHAKYNAGGYYPSHNFAFCQFALPAQEYNGYGEIQNVSIRNADSRDYNEFSHQWNYGFSDTFDNLFGKEWYDPGNQGRKTFQLWEKVEHDISNMYSWTEISDESDIVNGEEYIIAEPYYSYYATLLCHDNGEYLSLKNYQLENMGSYNTWHFYKVGDYYYINGGGKNLTLRKGIKDKQISINHDNYQNYLALREDGAGNLDRYEERYRWKYNFAEKCLEAYNLPQNPNENLESSELRIAPYSSSGVHIYKKTLRNPNNISIYKIQK